MDRYRYFSACWPFFLPRPESRVVKESKFGLRENNWCGRQIGLLLFHPLQASLRARAELSKFGEKDELFVGGGEDNCVP
jgi:hypothetical protein